jgi:hypothetical protein
MIETEILGRVLALIKDGTGWNPYFAYRNLSKDLKQKFSLYDMVVLFYKLEWNCRIIDIEEVYKTQAYDAWTENPIIEKKVIRYKLREDVLEQLTKDHKGTLAKIEKCLEQLSVIF